MFPLVCPLFSASLTRSLYAGFLYLPYIAPCRCAPAFFYLFLLDPIVLHEIHLCNSNNVFVCFLLLFIKNHRKDRDFYFRLLCLQTRRNAAAMELFGGNLYNNFMNLEEYFRNNNKIAVAFSGGVDSAYLLSEAVKAGADVRAYRVRSEFNPAFEDDDAVSVSVFLGVPLVQIDISVLGNEIIVSNPEDRCYHCKRLVMSAIKEKALSNGYDIVADGTNASDDADDRPGMKALAELGIRSPLKECGVTKEDVRSGAREAGLDIWDKPAYACLATRVPHGERITEAKLRGTEKAERILYDMGFRDFRVRWRGADALVQLKADQLDEAFDREEEIKTALGRIYNMIEIDDEPR